MIVSLVRDFLGIMEYDVRKVSRIVMLMLMLWPQTAAGGRSMFGCEARLVGWMDEIQRI